MPRNSSSTSEAESSAQRRELTILMPCLNEAETLEVCVGKALGYLERAGIDGEVLIADNGSTDGSQDLARAAGARVVDVPRKGYGAALLGGIEAAHGDYIIMGDADDSYNFAELDAFVERLRAGDTLVMGNRFAGGIAPGAMPPLHKYLGNPVLSWIGRVLFPSRIRDFHCGLRGFNRAGIQRLHLQTTGMEFASEMVVKATLAGVPISEVPTTLDKDGRSRPPHLRSWRDGWRHLRFLLIFSPRWLFLYPGLLAFLIGLIGAVGLAFGPWQIAGVGLDAVSQLYFAALALVGYQALIFGILTKVYARVEGFTLPRSQRFEWLNERVTLESGVFGGAALFAIGLAIALGQLIGWGASGFGPLDMRETLQLAIPASLVMVLGVQSIMSGFFLGVLNVGLEHRK